MSQLPQNNEAFDDNPEYAKIYQEDDSEQSGTDDQPLPASELPPAAQGTQDGKRAANFSLLFGFLSPLSFVLGFWLLVQGLGESGLQVALAAPVLNILGIWQGRVAQGMVRAPSKVVFSTGWGYAFSSVSPPSSCILRMPCRKSTDDAPDNSKRHM